MPKSIKNYRLIYEKYIGQKIPKNWEVHHIDLNRNNNNIENLLALPKELHRKYHKLLFNLEVNNHHLGGINSNINPSISLKMIPKCFGLNHGSPFCLFTAEFYNLLSNEIQPYFAIKFLLSKYLNNKNNYSSLKYDFNNCKNELKIIYPKIKEAIDEIKNNTN